MVKAYSYIFLIYPMLLTLLSLKEKFNISLRKFNNILFIIAVGAFYSIYASPILARVDNSFLSVFTFLFVFFCFRDEMKLRDVFENYTIYWLTIFSIWNLIGFYELLILSGSLIVLRSTSNIVNSFSKPFLWLVLILISTLLQQMDLVQASMLRYWLLEVFYLVYFFVFFPRAGARINTLASVIFLIFSNFLMLQYFSVIPIYFRYILIGLQIFLLIGKSSGHWRVPIAFGAFFIVALPDMGLDKGLLTVTALYIGLFNERYDVSDKIYRPLLVLNAFAIMYILSEFYLAAQGQTFTLRVSSILLVVALVMDFLNRIKTLGQLSFEKSIPNL